MFFSVNDKDEMVRQKSTERNRNNKYALLRKSPIFAFLHESLQMYRVRAVHADIDAGNF